MVRMLAIRDRSVIRVLSRDLLGLLRSGEMRYSLGRLGCRMS
jgi:hypothetical protein